jgi:SH3-like domain-containing protein
MPAWSSPNPSLAQVVFLAEGTELAVIGRSGDWAQVRAVTGWSGWVDARLLVAKQ